MAATARKLNEPDIYQRKLNEFRTQLEELGDEFAANDDGEIELRDVHTFIMECVKLIQIEVESSSAMADFVLSTFTKDFVDTVKQAKALKNASALLDPMEVLKMFGDFLKKKASKIVIVDLIQTQKNRPVQPPVKANQQVPITKAQQVSASSKQPVKVDGPPAQKQAPDEGSGSEYEEIEEEFEEEIEEEPEEDLGNAEDLLAGSSPPNGKQQPPQKPPAAGDASPSKQPTKKKTVKIEGSAATTGSKIVTKAPQKDDQLNNELVKKQPPKPLEKVAAPKQQIQDKKLLFEDAAEKESQQQWKGPKLPTEAKKRPAPEIIVPIMEQEDDDNLFNGKDQSPLQNLDLPDSPNVGQAKARAHQQHGQSPNPQKPTQLVQQPQADIKNQQTQKRNDEKQTSLLNIDKFLLEDQESYKSPGLMDDIPDYIRQLSSIAFAKDIKDPQIQGAIQQFMLNRDAHYDERMILDDNIPSDPSNSKNSGKSQLQAFNFGAELSKGGLPALIALKNGKLSPQRSPAFSIAPKRNPSSDSLKEEKKMESDKNSPSRSPVGQPFLKSPDIDIKIEPLSKMKPTIEVKKLPAIFAKVERPPVDCSDNQSWFAVVSVNRIKAFKSKVEMQRSKLDEGVSEDPADQIEQKEESEEIDGVPRELESLQLHPIQEISQEQSLQESFKSGAVADPMVIQNPVPALLEMKEVKGATYIPQVKAFYEKVKYERTHQNEKVLTIIEKTLDQNIRSPNEIKNSAHETPIQALQIEKAPQIKPENLQLDKVTTPASPKIPREQKTGQAKILDVLGPSIMVQLVDTPSEDLQDKPKVLQLKREAHVEERPLFSANQAEEKIDKQLNLEEIRLNAQKQWKREQEAAALFKGEETPPLRTPEPLKKVVNKIKAVKALKSERPPTNAKFTEMLRQPVRKEERQVVPTIKVETTPDTEIDIEKRLEQFEKQSRQSPPKKQRKASVNEVLVSKPLVSTHKQIQSPLPQLPTLVLPKQEYKGNNSDTSPERKSRITQINPRQKLVKAIQLYDQLIARTDSDESKVMMIEASNDLKEQLETLDRLSIHQEELALDMLNPTFIEPKKVVPQFNRRIDPALAKTQARNSKYGTSVSPLPMKIKLSDRSPLNHSFAAVKLSPKVTPMEDNNLQSSDPQHMQLNIIKSDTNAAENKNQLLIVKMTEKPYDENAKRTIEILKEIFNHYSKQNLSLKVEYTFEDIKEDKDLLNLNKVTAFLQDFGIQVPSQKVAELFKKSALQSKIMQFDQFRDFIESLYLRRQDTEREKIKRKLLSVNFRLKKASAGSEDKNSVQALMAEKQQLKKQLMELSSKGLDINAIYLQIRDDLKLDDQTTVRNVVEQMRQFHTKMRGYIPEYEKISRIGIKLPQIGSKATSPRRMEEEIAAASAGVPKIPEFLQLQEIMRKNREQEAVMREQLRDQSRSQRKLLAQQSTLQKDGPSSLTLETIKQRQGSKLQQKAILDLIDIHPDSTIRSKTKLKHRNIWGDNFNTERASPLKMRKITSIMLPELNLKATTNRQSVLSTYATADMPSPILKKQLKY